MKKAILGFLTLGLTVTSLAANAESDTHRFVRDEAISRQSDDRELIVHAARPSSRLWAEFSERGDRQAAASRAVTTRQSATPGAVAAPEIDPASAVSGLTLLLGGLAVFRGRRTPPKA